VAIAQWGGAALARIFIPTTGPLSVASDFKAIGIAIGAALNYRKRAGDRARSGDGQRPTDSETWR
jgi:hypothetical protein